jgi:two-component system, chemotaxis family, protein-glutamate methylesterase/glutaminase
LSDNIRMVKRNIIVIGASSGGFEAIKRLVSGLPADLAAPIFIVWHMSPDVVGILPDVINRFKTLPAANAVDRDTVIDGRIYVAPPDHHLLLERGNVRLSRGPKENRFRPAIDPLFRSAAYTFGPRVIGVILSGALDDGSAGMWTIKKYGGLAVVQDPVDAQVASMPESVMQTVKVDHVVPIKDMAALLTRLVREDVPEEDNRNGEDIRTETEIRIAMEDNPLENNMMKFGELSPYTCPECHGVLTALREGGRMRFRCHTGHGFSADSLLVAVTENIEDNLWNAVRNIQESVILLNHMGDHFSEVNKPKLAAMYFTKAKEAEARATLVREAVSSHEQLNRDKIRFQTESKE